MTTRVFRILSIVVLAALILSACGGKTSTVAKPPLRVGWSLWPGWYPMAIAMEQGLFEKHGVTVDPIFFNVYKETTPALASGYIDGAGLVLGDTLLDEVAKNTKVVLITDNSDGADQLVASADIKSPKDVVGKRIGVSAGTFGELLVQQMLDQNGISIADVTLVEVPPEGVPDAIPDTIDAGHTFEPYASQARAKGYNVIFSSADAPGLIVDVFAFNRRTLQERPEDVKAFIAAWFEAVQYWQEHPTEGNSMIAKVTGLPVQEISAEGVKLFDRAANLAAFQPGNSTMSLPYTAQLEIDYLAQTGVLSSPVKVEEALDASFLQ